MDPLSLLREFTIKKKKVVLSSDEQQLVFDDVRIPRNTLTNYRSDRGRSNFYSLDTLWFFLQKPELHGVNKFAQYRDECRKWNIQTVRIVDRQDLLSYLNGDTDSSACIVSALDRPELAAPTAAPAPPRRPAAEVEQPTKKARTENGELIFDDELRAAKENFVSWLESRQGAVNLDGPESIKVPESSLPFISADRDLVHEIQSKERTITNLENCFLSSKRAFSSLLDLREKALKSSRHGSGADKSGAGGSSKGGVGGSSRGGAAAGGGGGGGGGGEVAGRHNRYELTEDITTKASGMGEDVERFGIRPGMSFAGGKSAQKGGKPSSSSSANTASNTASDASSASQSWIIIVPSAPTSLISLLNAREFFEDGEFVTQAEKKEKGEKKPSVVTFSHGASHFKVVDAVTNKDDWNRVVAVIVHGPEWQFKSFIPSRPVEIFDKYLGFHLKFHDEPAHPNVAQWNVKVLSLNRLHRHRDKAIQNEFWAGIDHYLKTKKAK